MKTGTTAKSKFKKLKRRLGLPLCQVVGILESLWLTTYSDAPDGDIGRMSNEDIAAAIEFDGDPDALIAALADSGWLDRSERFRLIVHHWSQECANFHKGNYRRHGKLFADEVEAGLLGTVPGSLLGSVPGTVLEDGPRDRATKPNQTKPDQPKETSCSETAKPSSLPFDPPPEEPAVLEFPCDGNPSAWRLTGSQLAEWGKLFPSLDLLAECRAALAWVLADPSRRKTARGMPKFLVGWFSRSQNRGGKEGTHGRRHGRDPGRGYVYSG